MIYGDYLRNKYHHAEKTAEAEGVPCVFENSKGKHLRNYRIYGNSVQGKNLLGYPYADTTKTVNGITFTDNRDGTVTINGTATARASFAFTLSPKLASILDKTKKHVLSINALTGSMWFYLSFFKNNVWLKEVGLHEWNLGNTFSVVADLPNIDYDRIGCNIIVEEGDTCDNLVIKPQLEEGETATEWQSPAASPDNPLAVMSVGDLVTDTASTHYGKYAIPVTVTGTGSAAECIYLSEPLRKVGVFGDYADYIDFKNQKVVRNVKKLTFNGSESWNLQGTNDKGIISFNLWLGADGAQTTNVEAVSTLFPHMRESLTSSVCPHFFMLRTSSSLSLYVRMHEEDMADLAAFKTWLSQNNLTVYYSLNTPVEESITLPSLRTFKGTNTVSVGTDMRAHSIKAEYVKI